METHSSAALSALWAFVGIVFVLVGLRLYTRLHLMDRHGPDDYVYTASSVCAIPTSMLHAAGLETLAHFSLLTQYIHLGFAAHPYGVHAGLSHVRLRTKHGYTFG